MAVQLHRCPSYPIEDGMQYLHGNQLQTAKIRNHSPSSFGDLHFYTKVLASFFGILQHVWVQSSNIDPQGSKLITRTNVS